MFVVLLHKYTLQTPLKKTILSLFTITGSTCKPRWSQDHLNLQKMTYIYIEMGSSYNWCNSKELHLF